MTEKYADFLNKVSEILGLNKPVDILRLCVVTDEYFKPLEKRIAELEKENTELKAKIEELKKYNEGFEVMFDFKNFMKNQDGGKR